MHKKSITAMVALALAIPAVAIASSVFLLANPKPAQAEEGKKEALQHVSDSDFDKEVLKSNTPVLVDFYADWCGPCKKMSPIIEEISKEMKGKLKVVKLNTDENTKTAKAYEITGIPAMFLFKKGQVVEKLVGLRPKEQVISAISKHL